MSERGWWTRTLLVLRRPADVFRALRGDDDDERQEPLLAVILLAGSAGVMSTNAMAHALDDFELDGLSLAVCAFVAGGIYGIVAYYAIGALVLTGERLAGSPASYRRSRHVLGFACVPLAASLLVLLVRATAFGEDAFRSGGDDTGTGGTVFEAIELAVLAWCAALLVVGLRAVNSWSWPRALMAAVPALCVPALVLARAYGLV